MGEHADGSYMASSRWYYDLFKRPYWVDQMDSHGKFINRLD